MAKGSQPDPVSPAPSVESRQARRTRAALLRAARTVFETRGYTNTRLEDITDEAGYSAGSFYSYYDSKEAIFSDVIRSLGLNVDEQRRVRAAPKPRAVHDREALERRIKATNERYFRSLATDGRLWAVVEEAALREDAPRLILDERWRRFRVGVTAALKQWQADGVVDSHRDLAAAVNSVSAMTEWLVTLRRVYGFTFPTTIGAAECTWAWMRTLTSPTLDASARRGSPRSAPAAKRRPATRDGKRPTRQRLVDAGFEEFSRSSVARARVADIARTAGVSVGSFYRHFPSKTDLLAAVLTADTTLLYHVPKTPPDVVAAIDAINRRHVTAVRAQAGFWRTVAEAALNEPLVRAIVNEQRTEWIDAVAALVRARATSGEVDGSVDPVAAAVCLTALTERSTHLHMLLEDRWSPGKAIAELNDCWAAILRVAA